MCARSEIGRVPFCVGEEGVLVESRVEAVVLVINPVKNLVLRLVT